MNGRDGAMNKTTTKEATTRKQLTEEELHQMYLHFKMLQEQIEQLTQQAEMLNQQNEEMDMTKHTIDELAKTSSPAEVLVPIADGIYVKANIKDTQNLIINVGADTVVEKTIPQAKKMVEEQKKRITLKNIEVQAILQGMQQQAMGIYKEIQEQGE